MIVLKTSYLEYLLNEIKIGIETWVEEKNLLLNGEAVRFC